jgi:hypothetical protein
LRGTGGFDSATIIQVRGAVSGQSVAAMSDKVEETFVPQGLKLLTHLLFDVIIRRIEYGHFVPELVHLVEGEFRSPDALDASHHIQQPPFCDIALLVMEEDCSLPFAAHIRFGSGDTVADQIYLSCLRYCPQQESCTRPIRLALPWQPMAGVS